MILRTGGLNIWHFQAKIKSETIGNNFAIITLADEDLQQLNTLL